MPPAASATRWSTDERALHALVGRMLGAAREAAVYIRSRARDAGTLTWETKSPMDFVSEVDVNSEELLRSILRVAPDYWASDVPVRFVAEEESPELVAGDGITYVVDPLDGTTNFLHGYPQYAVSVAALVDGLLAAGVVVNVPSGETFTATAGGGAWRGEERLRVSTITEPSRALLGTGFPFKHREGIEPYLRSLPAILASTAGIRRAGSAALDLCDVACGRFEAFWELMLAPWDVAAGLLLIREAGGVVTDLEGRHAPVAHGPIVAGNPEMHRWLLQQLRDSGLGTLG